MKMIMTPMRIALIAIAMMPFAFADEDVPSDAQRYNEAVELYAAGETMRAVQTLEQLSGSDRDEVAARSRYNLGNDRYAEALKVLESDGSNPVKAVGLLQDAVKHYRSSLGIAPNDQDARANIELAMQLISQIQQQQNEQKSPEQQQQQKEQEQQQQDPQQQNEPDSEQSESKQDPSPSNDSDPRDESKTEKSEGQQSQDAGQEGESESNSEAQPSQDQNQGSAENNPSQSDANEGQSETSESADNDQGQSGDSQSMQPDADTDPAPSPENPNSNQSPASPADDNSDADPSDAAPQPTETAESDPSKTEGELSAVNGQNENIAADEDDPQKPTAVGVMTQDEANKMLQAIRDREMLRRMQTEREQRRRQVPVDKDW
ncbi:hypothetical protein SH528x_001319 [Novipirellula sp. SH528]|uniref:hypothetical protein n=1 Tax=Novipirellula sp. SH528 TaxID=3454466 RepID=UPI003F9FC4DB